MKKKILIIAVVLSFTYTYSANQMAYTKTNNLDPRCISTERFDEPFDFDHKAYLPKDFNACDLTANETNTTLLVEEDTDEPFDFDHKAYLPVGFNPSKSLNPLFLKNVNWVEEDTDEPLDFNYKRYLPIGFNPSKELNHLFLNDLPWIDEEEIE